MILLYSREDLWNALLFQGNIMRARPNKHGILYNFNRKYYSNSISLTGSYLNILLNLYNAQAEIHREIIIIQVQEEFSGPIYKTRAFFQKIVTSLSQADRTDYLLNENARAYRVKVDHIQVIHILYVRITNRVMIRTSEL